MNADDGLWLRLVSKRDAVKQERPWEGPEGTAAAWNSAKVFVVDDDVEMRELLVRLLAPLRVPIVTFQSAEEFLAAYEADQEGCLLLDVKLPGMDGFALFNALKGLGSPLPVVFLTGYADVACARYALLAGAADFLEKPVERRALLTAIRSAFDSDQARRRSAAMCQRLSGLTAREWDVLRLVVAGKANKVVGAELGISQKTVEAHRARVMAKTAADSLADLVRMFSTFESCQIQAPSGREARQAQEA